MIIAASAVAIDGRALLIRGASGAGKSELALLLIDRGATLISDDQCELVREGERLFASPAPNIAGKLEVRNLGILEFPVENNVPVSLILELTEDAPRFTDRARLVEIESVGLPQLLLEPHCAALPVKAERALRRYGLPN